MSEADALQQAFAEMMKPKPRKPVNKVTVRPPWAATEENAENEAKEVVKLLREFDLTEDEATDVVAASLLLVAGRLSQRQVENRVTVVLKSAISRRERKAE